MIRCQHCHTILFANRKLIPNTVMLVSVTYPDDWVCRHWLPQLKAHEVTTQEWHTLTGERWGEDRTPQV